MKYTERIQLLLLLVAIIGVTVWTVSEHKEIGEQQQVARMFTFKDFSVVQWHIQPKNLPAPIANQRYVVVADFADGPITRDLPNTLDIKNIRQRQGTFGWRTSNATYSKNKIIDAIITRLPKTFIQNKKYHIENPHQDKRIYRRNIKKSPKPSHTPIDMKWFEGKEFLDS